MLSSAERQEVASLAANGLQSDVKMATVMEMSLQCMPALSASCMLNSTEMIGGCSALKMRGDTPNLDYTEQCCGGASPPPLEVSGQHV